MALQTIENEVYDVLFYYILNIIIIGLVPFVIIMYYVKREEQKIDMKLELIDKKLIQDETRFTNIEK
jgi:hypothetical protein